MIMRQGDILIVPIHPNNIPTHTVDVNRDNGRAILAHGEVTGHAHAITDPNCDLITDQQANELYLIVYGESVNVTHEEHNTITLDPGAYRIFRQREYVAENLTSPVDD
jgi:hypothetical protein